MALRVVSKIDTSKLRKTEMIRYNALVGAAQAAATKLSSLPEKLPEIDWSHYKSHASDPKLVDQLQKNYQAIKVDQPKAPPARLQQLEAAKAQDQARAARFVKIAESYITSAKVVQENFERMIPVKDMTTEDWVLTFPEWSPTLENPSVAPHYGRMPGLSREEAAAFDQPDVRPYSTKSAWLDWEDRKKKFYD